MLIVGQFCPNSEHDARVSLGEDHDDNARMNVSEWNERHDLCPDTPCGLNVIQ